MFSKEFSGLSASGYSKPWFLLDIRSQKPEDDSLHTTSPFTLRPQGASLASPPHWVSFSLPQLSLTSIAEAQGPWGPRELPPQELGHEAG